MNTPLYKKHLIALSCATALTSFALVAKPAFADDIKTDTGSKTEVLAETKTSETTALADVKTSTSTVLSEAPASSESAAPNPEITSNLTSEAVTSEASSTSPSEVASTSSDISKSEVTKPETPSTEQTSVASSETASATAEHNHSETGKTGGYYSDDQGNWYYKDASGQNLTGAQVVDYVPVYFDQDGKQVKGAFAPDGHYYAKDSGALVTSQYIDVNGDWYYVDADGNKLTGPQTIDYLHVYFDQNGKQIKGAVAPDGNYYDPYNGNLVAGQYYTDGSHFYDKDSGHLASNRYVEYKGSWYYVNDKGDKVTGAQTIDGVKVYFDETGAQVKGSFAYHDFNNYYYDKDSGALVTNDFVEDKGNRYYVDKNGRKFHIGGVHRVKGQDVAFVYGDGHVALGEWLHPAGTNGFYDFNNKLFTGPGFITDRNGVLYYFNGTKQRPINLNIIDGNLYYLGNPSDKYANGKVYRDGLIQITNANPILENSSNIFYFDKETGAAIKSQYKEIDGSWYYFGPNWYALTGEQVVDFVPVYFDKDGKQVKGAFADNDRYYDKDSGALVTSKYIEVGGDWYYVNEKGDKLIGEQIVDYVSVYFDKDGKQVKGAFADNGRYYDKDSGALVTNKYIEVGGDWYYVNEKGDKLTGPQVVDYVHVAFDQNGKQIKDRLVVTMDGDTYHYYLPNSGARAENVDITIAGVTYHFDADGNGHEVPQAATKETSKN